MSAGKWTKDKFGVIAGRVITRNGVPFVSLNVCKPSEHEGWNFAPEEADQFTHFAAAAPEMAEALEKMTAFAKAWFAGENLQLSNTEIREAEAALRKARGEV